VKERLRERARQLGFDECRVTSAEPPATASAFEAWLRAGNHGAMAYLERNSFKRVEPRQILADAQSIVVLAVSYFLPDSGTIARYARHQDYHDVLASKLTELTTVTNELTGPGTRSLWYVDTGPLLERDLAQRAGIGFAGKHTNLISRTLGNYIFLAEIITTARIEPDAPEQNRCGSCSRCLSACPTNAIVAPFQLDARRCISYLTIELKGSIPEELRAGIGHRIYGCDACLEVCPWNRFAKEGRVMRDFRRSDLDQPNLLELLQLDDRQFKARFKDTPMLRTKRRGLLRNVCVALGNTAGEEALPALRTALEDREPLVVEHARWAIEQIEKRLTARPESATTPPPSRE
jgi:epoxyqueuosine reductase